MTDETDSLVADLDDSNDSMTGVGSSPSCGSGADTASSADTTADADTVSDSEHSPSVRDLAVSQSETTSDSESSAKTRDFPTVDSVEKDYVEVSVTVDTSEMDADETAVLVELAEQFEDAFYEIYEKNRDYDWSFLASGSKLAASSGTPFDHPARSQAFGLVTRAADKQERLVENVFGDGDAAVSDDPAVTAMEASNYYQFLAFVLDNPELAASFGTLNSRL